MNLLATFDRLIGSWRDVFPQERTFQRARAGWWLARRCGPDGAG